MSTPASSPDESPSARSELFELLERSRERLRRMLQLRIDSRVRGRIDPSDVIQEAYVEAVARYEEYSRAPSMPPFLWLRFLTAQKLIQQHRRHIKAAARDATREVSLDRSGLPGVSSPVMAAEISASHTSPSSAAQRNEVVGRLQETLHHMDPLDREILALRHFEQLSNAECAEVLDLKKSTASSRYVRALEKLQVILAGS